HESLSRDRSLFRARAVLSWPPGSSGFRRRRWAHRYQSRERFALALYPARQPILERPGAGTQIVIPSRRSAERRNAVRAVDEAGLSNLAAVAKASLSRGRVACNCKVLRPESFSRLRMTN